MFFGHTENFILRYYVWFSQIRSHLLLLSQSRDHIKHVITCLASLSLEELPLILVLHAVFLSQCCPMRAFVALGHCKLCGISQMSTELQYPNLLNICKLLPCQQ